MCEVGVTHAAEGYGTGYFTEQGWSADCAASLVPVVMDLSVDDGACEDAQESGIVLCPAGTQDKIDAAYADCDGESANDGITWDDWKAQLKTEAEACGCGGVASATPTLFVAVAAVANHFLA